MSEPYFDQPLRPPSAGSSDQGRVQRNEVNESVQPSPGIDPTVPGTQPRGEPHLEKSRRGHGEEAQSEETQNQQATSGKSRAESGTP